MPLNKVVNLAVESFLGMCDREELQLLARREALLREEGELRHVCSAMLRSGSYLPSYAQKVLKQVGRPLDHLMDSQRPLLALNPREERVFRKIMTRREQIAEEICEIEERLLKDIKPFRLKPEASWSHRRRRDKVKFDGGEKNGKIAEDG